MDKAEKLNLAKYSIGDTINEDNPNYGLFLFSCYGLLDKFGSEYAELIKMIFTDSNFFLENKPLQELIDKTGYQYKVVKGEKATSFTGVFGALDSQLNFRIKQEKPIVCISTTDISANEFLSRFTHEISHIIKGLIRSVIMQPNENIVTIRRGLVLEKYNTEARDLNAICYNEILEEVTTVFQTADMMESICQLDRELLNDNVKLFYDQLDLSTLSLPCGYERTIPYFETLWQNDSFKHLIDDNVIMGNVEKIEEEFDGIIGQDKFKRFSQALDNLYCANCTGIKKVENGIFLKRTINDYNKITSKKESKKVKS